MMILIGVSFGCAGDDGDAGGFCGDGVCQAGEACALDCGASACTASPDNCTGEAICVGGSCVAAFPRVYRLTNIAVSVPTTNPNNGQAWDAGGGAPDLFIGDPTGVPISNVVADQFSATFPGPFEVQLIGGSSLRLDIWDEDLTTDDHALACVANPVTAQLLRGRSFACSANGISLSSSIQPK